jgi:sulfur relay (sulfurtransferase) DsrF/TusC family protein
VSKNWIKQLHTLPVLHFNICLTPEYSETTAYFNGNFDTDNQIYVSYRSLSAQRLSERTVVIAQL